LFRKLNRFLGTPTNDPLLPPAGGLVRDSQPFCEARFSRPHAFDGNRGSIGRWLVSGLIEGASNQRFLTRAEMRRGATDASKHIQ